jgi:ectoine hydroxylase-related dioxygenase (phytanoyl-CoA dioxygenase family)
LSSDTIPIETRGKVEVQSWPADTPYEKVTEFLRKARGVIIKNFANIEDTCQMEKELRPLLDKDRAWEGSFFPKATRRCHNLVTNSPTFAEKGIMNPLYQAMMNEYMMTSNWFWQGHRRKAINEQKRRHALHSWLAPVDTWGGSEEPIEELTVSAELEVGDAFIMFGSCYHGGGANTTNDEERLLFSFSTRGWLRQENYYLSVPLNIAKKIPHGSAEVHWV